MIVEIVEGVLIVTAGGLGNVMGWTRGRAERNIINLFTTGQAENLYCLCGHASSFHVKGVEQCNHRDPLSVNEIRAMGADDVRRAERQLACRCQKFVGDSTRNPPPVQTRKDVLDLGQ